MGEAQANDQDEHESSGSHRQEPWDSLAALAWCWIILVAAAWSVDAIEQLDKPMDAAEVVDGLR